MKRKGFTLLEIMVVIAIIAILGTVAGTRYANSVKKAKAAECLATRSIVTDAENRFRIEHEGRASKNYQELKDSGYLQVLPVCKAGGIFAWIMNTGKNSGRHLACSIHGDAMSAASPAIPAAAPVYPNPPKSQADCPPGTDYMKIVDVVKKQLVPSCVPKCPPGQKHHPVTGICLTPTLPGAIHYCPQNWHWSSKLNRCDTNGAGEKRAVILAAPKVCAGGRTWDETAGQCQTSVQPSVSVAHPCPRMWKWSDRDNKCSPNASAATAIIWIMDRPRECSGGLVWDETAGYCK